jgi:hypothetical protein
MRLGITNRAASSENIIYSVDRVPEIKVLDFIFWAAGKLSFEAEQA